MTKILSFLFAACTLVMAPNVLSAQELYLGEFNIRNDNAKDAVAGNGWAVRCPVVCDILKVESFDTQEVLHNQLEAIKAGEEGVAVHEVAVEYLRGYSAKISAL